MRYFLGIIPLGRESSAFGYAQALDGTWADYKKATGRSIARRSSIRDSADFMGWYMTKTRKLTGVSLSDAKNQYLAYHEVLFLPFEVHAEFSQKKRRTILPLETSYPR